MVWDLFLSRLNYFGNKYRGARSIFGRIFESSSNVPQHIGICPQALISNVGIIKSHKNHKNKQYETKHNQNKRVLFFPYRAFIGPAFGPPYRAQRLFDRTSGRICRGPWIVDAFPFHWKYNPDHAGADALLCVPYTAHLSIRVSEYQKSNRIECLYEVHALRPAYAESKFVETCR